MDDQTATYDPAADDVAAVNAYLETADADEVQRVLAAELAGKGRKGILEGPATQQAPVEGIAVVLRHHWTDATGTSHVPGAEVTVPRDTADQLTAAGYAVAAE